LFERDNTSGQIASRVYFCVAALSEESIFLADGNNNYMEAIEVLFLEFDGGNHCKI
jgi:hypothetical protein